MSAARDGAASALGVDRGQKEKRWDVSIENIGQDGPLDHPLPEYYFACPPEREYIFSKAHVEGNGTEYKPRPLELDENGGLPPRVHKLSDNEATWTEANNLRQLYAMQVAQVKKRPETYEDLYDYFDGHDLYEIGAYNAFNLISTLADQNKILDPFIQRDKKKVMETFLDEWLAKNPEAEDRLLSWNWQRDSSARVVLDGYGMFPELGYLTDDDKMIFSAIIAKRYETVKAARAARSARLNPIVVNGSGDGNFGNRSASQSSNGRGTLRRSNDSSNANTSIPVPATTAGPVSSARAEAEVPMVTAAAPVSASRYIFNGSHSVKVSGPSIPSHNRHWTDTKHPSATNLSPQALRTRQRLSGENKQMARGLPAGKPDGIPASGQSPSRKLPTKPARNGVHNGGAQYHAGYNPDTTPTKPSRHALVHSPPGAMVSNPFAGRSHAHAGFGNQPAMPHELPQPGFLHQPAGHQGGIGRDISAIGIPGFSPNQGPRATGFHGDVHSRTVSNYQRISPSRNPMTGQQHQQTTPTTRFASSQRRASGSGPPAKNGPRANGAGWALSEQQDSIHGPKFVHNKAKGNTSGGPKPRRNSAMSVPSPGARNQQAGNGKLAAAAATATEDTKSPNQHGNGGNGYVRPPPQTRETCLNYGLPNTEPAVECPCATCTHRSRNVTVTVMGGGVLERSDEEALRKHFGRWGRIERVIFPRMPTGFYHGMQGGQSRPPNRAYITFASDTIPPVVVEEANGKLCPGIRGALRVLHSACSKHFRGVSPPTHRRTYGEQPTVNGPVQHYHHQPGHPNVITAVPPPMAPPVFANGGFNVAPPHPRPLPMPPMAAGGFDQGPPQYAQLGDSPPRAGEQWAANVSVQLPALPPRPVAPIMSASGLHLHGYGLSTPPRQVRMVHSEPGRLPGSLTSTPSPKKEPEWSEVKQPQQKQQEMGKKSQSSEKPHESVEAQRTGNSIPSNSRGPQARQNNNKLSLPGMHRSLSVVVSEGKVTTPSLSTGNSTIIMTPPGSDESSKGRSNDGSPRSASQLEIPASTEENSGTVVVHRSRKTHGSIPKEWRADSSAAELPGRADGYVADSERAESSMKPPEGGQDKEGEQVKPAHKKKNNKKKQKNKAQVPGKDSQDGQQGHEEQNVPAADGSAAGTDAAVVKKNATTKKHQKSAKFGKRGHVEDPASENTTAESRAASRATTTISSGRSTPAALHRAEETQTHKARKKQQPRSATPEPESNKTGDAAPSTAQTPEKSGKEGDGADLTVRKNRVDRDGDAVGMLTATSATPKHCGAKSTDPTSRVSPFAAQKYEIDRLNADNTRESSASTLRAASFNKNAGLDANSKPPHHIRSGSTLPRGFDPYPRVPTVAAPRGVVAAPPPSARDRITTGQAPTKGKMAEGGASSTADGAARPPQTGPPGSTPPTTPISSPKMSSATAAQDALPPSPPCSVKGQGQALNPTAKPFTASLPTPKVAVPSDGGGGNVNNNSNNAGKRKNRKNNNKKGGAAAPVPVNQPPKPEPGKDGSATATSSKQPEPEGDDSRIVVEHMGLHEERRPPQAVQEHEHGQEQEQELDDTEPEPETTDYAQGHQAAAADHVPSDDNTPDDYLLAMGHEESEGTSTPVLVDHAVQHPQHMQPREEHHDHQRQNSQQQQQPQRYQQQRGQGFVAAGRGRGAGGGGGGGGGYASAAAGKSAHKPRPSFGSAKAWPALGAESGGSSNRHHYYQHHHHQRNNSRAASGDKPAARNSNPPASPASSATLSVGSNKSAATAARGSMKGSIGGALRSGSPPAATATAAKPPVRVHSSIELSKALRDHKARVGSSGKA